MTLRTVAIVPAAGSGARLGLKEKKPFVLLAGKPLIIYALKALETSASIQEIIVASEAGSIGRLERLIEKYGFKKVSRVVKGGSTRAESVRNCIKKIAYPCDIVLIHDGARPFPGKKAIRDSIILAEKYGSCITAIRVTDTIKKADKKFFVAETLDRNLLWRAQTPQAFRYELLRKAFSRIKVGAHITDDASLLERIGKKVKILEDSSRNIKITTKEDLKLAEVLCLRKERRYD